VFFPLLVIAFRLRQARSVLGLKAVGVLREPVARLLKAFLRQGAALLRLRRRL